MSKLGNAIVWPLPTVLSSAHPDVSTLWHICTCAPFAQLGTCSLCSTEQVLIQVSFVLPPPGKIMLCARSPSQEQLVFDNLLASQNPLANIPSTSQIICLDGSASEYKYSSIYIAPLNSHGRTEAILVRLAPRRETIFKK